MSILVIAEHDHQGLKAATLNTVSAARQIGGDIHLLIAGHHCSGAASQAAGLEGVSCVKLADAAHYADQGAENLTALVLAHVAGYSHVLAPATTFGKNLAPRLAALLDVAQISEITAVESPDTFVRPIYAGNALATVQSRDAVKVITVRSTAFEAAKSGGKAPIEAIAAAADTGKAG
jgi:electron transfer flavoprotein alpha subunit